MGIEPFLVGSSLDCVLAQRLARRLCDWCKEPYAPTEAELAGARWPYDLLEAARALWRPVGCRSCANTGYRGRIALHEVMPVSEEIERLAVERASAHEIQRVALARACATCALDGLAQGRRRGDLDSPRSVRVAVRKSQHNAVAGTATVLPMGRRVTQSPQHWTAHATPHGRDARRARRDARLVARRGRRLRPAPDRRRAADDPGPRRPAPPARLRRRSTADDTAMLVRAAVLNDEQWERFEHDPRARLRLRHRRASPASASTVSSSATRTAPSSGPSRTTSSRCDELGMPDQIARFAHLPRGLVLVTGPTGSGKTTTLAGVLDLANRTRATTSSPSRTRSSSCTTHKRCLVNQREVGVDTDAFATALKHALRQDPDIILVGELRDLETTSTALTAAETGHLVLATLHTQSAAQTIDRVIDIFPPHQQQQIRAQLSTALQGVVTQALAPARRRHGPHGHLRDHVRHAGHPQPDPRGQEPPDPVVHAVLRRRRHVDLRPAPGRAGPRAAGQPTSRRWSCATRPEEFKRLAGRM